MKNTIVNMTREQAEAFASGLGMDLAAPCGEGAMCQSALLNGRIVRRVTETTFEYSASNGDCRRFEERAAELVRKMPARRATAEAEPEALATTRQITLITTLIARDPGAAMTVGATADGARILPGLTKSVASRMITQMLGGV